MTSTLTRCTTPAATRWLEANHGVLSRSIAGGVSAADKAARVAGSLTGRLPSLDILTDEQLVGNQSKYQQHILHASQEFSITALVWRPGQQTSIHDHVCWCTVAVLKGIEHEILYRLDTVEGRPVVGETEHRFSGPGTISHFAPPGDIHRVRNTGDEVAVSLHVYGTDISLAGTSVLNIYGACLPDRLA